MRLVPAYGARIARILVVLIAAALLPASAHAAVIDTPPDGLVTEQGQPLYFDWAWDADEYATSSIVLTRSPDPANPIWRYGPAIAPSPDRFVYADCSYGVCGPYLTSHATLELTVAAGDWWWRLCNKSIYGEDDKCSYDTGVPPRKLTITSKPAPAAPAPAGHVL